jgi:hypothetical protein
MHGACITTAFVVPCCPFLSPSAGLVHRPDPLLCLENPLYDRPAPPGTDPLEFRGCRTRTPVTATGFRGCASVVHNRRRIE